MLLVGGSGATRRAPCFHINFVFVLLIQLRLDHHWYSTIVAADCRPPTHRVRLQAAAQHAMVAEKADLGVTLHSEIDDDVDDKAADIEP